MAHAHHVRTDEPAAEAPPSQKFGANAAWFRLNVLLHNLLTAFKRITSPPELHTARPTRLRFVLLNGIGKVVRHARATVLRLAGEVRRKLADAARRPWARARRPISSRLSPGGPAPVGLGRARPHPSSGYRRHPFS